MRRKSQSLLAIFLMFSFLSGTVSAGEVSDKVLRIYLDADRTVLKESAKSIEMGIRSAFAEIDNKIDGFKIEFVPLDHRGNVHRSHMHMKRFSKR